MGSAGLRFSLAALVLLGVMAVRRFPLPRGKALVGARVTNGFAITPIVTVLLSAWLDDEPIRVGPGMRGRADPGGGVRGGAAAGPGAGGAGEPVP